MTRQISNHRQTNEQKMLYHQERLEYWQAIIDEAEKKAYNLAVLQLQVASPRKDGLVQDPNYLAKVLLQDNFRYNRAIGNRNGHEKGVSVYAALLESERT
jgi:hypothetical protein